MSAVVVDASVAAAWFLQDEATQFTDSILVRASRDGLVVPALWRFELANVLLVCQRRGRLDSAATAQMLLTLDTLDIRTHERAASPSALVDAGQRHNLSAYDAAYLLTAKQVGLPLASNDAALVAAARAEGISVLTDLSQGSAQ